MPLTFAHPAAVLPLFRGPLVPAALVAGSMSPDVPYFLRATGTPVTAQSWYEPFVNATVSHSWLGALTVSLPLALLLYLALLAAARPVRTLLPDDDGGDDDGVAGRPARRPRLLAVRAGWVLLSLAGGVATHLLWDSLTHGGLADGVPALAQPLVGPLTGARVLQHGSTAVGLVAIAVVLWRRRDRLVAPPGTRARARLGWTVAGAVAAGALGAAVVTALRWAPATLEHALSGAALGAGIGVATAAAVAVTTWWLVRLRRRATA